MRFILFTASLLICALSFGQTLNPDFELWQTNQNSFNATGSFQGVNFWINEPVFNYEEVTDWSSTNQLTNATSFGSIALITKAPSPFSGDSAVQLRSLETSVTVQTDFGPFPFDNVAPGLIISGNITLNVQELLDNILEGGSLDALNPFKFPETGQPIDFRPGTLTGYYQYTGAGGDSAVIVSGVVKEREIVAYTISRLGDTPANTWTQFNLDFEYVSCDLPDTIITLVCASNLDIDLNVGGEFEITSNYTGEDGSQLRVDAFSMDTVDPANFPPLANNDLSTILNIDSAVVDVTDNDESCVGGVLNPVVLNGPSNGSLSTNTSNEFVYTPNPGFTGTDTIEYEVCTAPTACDTAIWLITVNGVPPCVADDLIRTITPDIVDLIDVSNANCGGQPTIVTNAMNGASNVEANNQISYSPNNGFIGNDTIVYSICNVNDNTQCDTASIFVTVITSIQELPAQSYSIYPNPLTGDNLVIETSGLGETKVRIFDINGREVVNNSFIESTEIDLGRLSNSVYFVHIQTARGKATERMFIAR